ncbi:adenosylcobinamide-phosphate synthase CbiB [Clostridium guangxiense]|uniref:adenosylcobinamide-phosphate synthase CbiB n=1 Tax=Clostridium guangxiense TaxID=1662055 RepID=UPI001E4596F6|nr:adenosylcobinamide-phosphate synthase CbiB [Clostridium guangxiense]MCD2348511.1 adenosylcobinamide-phosphate synthase CbiB [Clostridium guangxiense]
MIDFLLAVILDFCIGDPYFLPHPIKLMGNVISFEEKKVRSTAKNNNMMELLGGIVVIINLFLAFLIPFLMLKVLKSYSLIYHIVNTYFLYTCIAAGCLQREGMKVAKAFEKGIEEARYRLSFIVGRETGNLSESEIIRADVETVAENTSDGVIAPMLYAAIGGAPLAFLYKMVNTMDSMLGYKNEKYLYIGHFPAKADDVFNFIPARLTGVLMCFGSVLRFDVLNGLKVMIRDRKNHKSPNCAYPEGAAAGLLGVQLGGNNVYFGEIMRKPKIGDKKRELELLDIKKTIEIMYRAEILFTAVYFIVLGGVFNVSWW